MPFDVAIRASQGARRAQEDCAFAWPRPPVCDYASALVLPPPVDGEIAAVLCDGMGGHVGGAIASRIASETFLPALSAADSREPRRKLFEALDAANAAIAAHIAQNPRYRSMGATLVGVHVGADGLTWVSVGDSLLYLWRRGAMAVLNADHSLAPELDKLAEAGKMSWADAQSDPRRHQLRSALVGGEIEMIDLAECAVPLEVGDVVLIASDGLNSLEPAVIASIVGDHAQSGADAIAQGLLAAVDAAGVWRQDNTTVVGIVITADASDAAPDDV